jgi:hypothetical protein
LCLTSNPMANCSIRRYRGVSMLGYVTNDLDEMVSAIQSALTTVNSDDDPWLYNNLWKAQEFLQGLWAEGYFD